MGIFRKKLDYSQGSGVLPKLEESQYVPLRLPSTSLMLAPNLPLMEMEREQGNLEKAFGESVSTYLAPENEASSREVIEKYLGSLPARMAPSLSEEATQVLGNYIGVGFGMAIVESKSGLMISGKSHPSIMNVISRLLMNIGDDQKALFRGIPVYQQLIEIAVQVGYVGTRMNPSPSVEEMLRQVRAN